MSREELESVLISNSKNLSVLEEDTFDNEVTEEQLQNQRDILIENLFSS